MSVSDEILQRIESGMSDPMDVTKRMLAREILRLRARLAEIERPLKFTEMRNRPAKPTCGTCGDTGWATESARQVGVVPVVGSCTFPCPTCSTGPEVIESPSNPTVDGIERADSPFVAPKCGMCGGSYEVPVSVPHCPECYGNELERAHGALSCKHCSWWMDADEPCPECSKGGDR